MKEAIERNKNGDLMLGSKITYEFGEGNIVVTLRGDNEWHSQIEGEKAWSLGRTISEAVGSLIVLHSERFSIVPES